MVHVTRNGTLDQVYLHVWILDICIHVHVLI